MTANIIYYAQILQKIMESQKVSHTIIEFIRKEVKERNSHGVVLGLSGGLDSSVVAILAVRALTHPRVFGLILPDSKITPKNDIEDAIELAKNLKITHRIIEIGNTKGQLLKHLPKNKLAQGNFSSRLRMSIIYYYAGIKNYLVLGTADKSELKLGYYTKYGDGAVPSTILKKKSSPRIWKGQTAESEIGISYEEIDEILQSLETSSLKKYNFDSNRLKTIVSMVQKNLHKQEMPPICKIRESI
jgi:NAD+ synthase